MTDFSAKASTVGSLHQVRYSLVLLLEHEEATLELEGLDDIALSTQGAPDQLLQLKHRAAGTMLTDADPDLWKTLRIWAEHIDEGRVSPTVAIFTLATTASAASGSAALQLRPGKGRDVAAALGTLQKAAADSSNKALEKAFAAFNKLGPARQMLLLDHVFILDDSPSILTSRVQLESRLAPTIRREHRGPLADRLEGWWLRQCVSHLRGQRAGIKGVEVYEQAQLLAEQFRATALPIDYFDAKPSDVEAKELSRRQFVEQLRVLGVNSKRIENAVHDYYRSFVQRSRWATDRLLIGDEIHRYERHLREEWERIRDLLSEEIGPDATEEELKKVGNKILKWAEYDASIHIRPDVTVAYLLRGSFHILADEKPPKIWWHPEFFNRLSGIVGASI